MTLRLREAPPADVRASRTEWLRSAWAGRIAEAVLAGGFLSFVGAFGAGRMAPTVRTVFFVLTAVLARLMGMASFAALGRVRWFAARWWRQGAACALLMTLPLSVVVAAGLEILAGGRIPGRAIAEVLPDTLVACLFFCLSAAYRGRLQQRAAQAPAHGAARPRFLERLPPKLRGAELWAVEAEDHYLRLHTSKGQDLILMRFSDAIGELAELEGAQAHRSWWVARAAVREVRRADGRATLTLEDGTRIPVSRTHARALRARGWL